MSPVGIISPSAKAKLLTTPISNHLLTVQYESSITQLYPLVKNNARGIKFYSE